MRQARPTAATALVAALFSLPAAAHGLDGASGSDPGRPVASAAEIASVLNDCAGRLGPGDVGLARVARQCPGIEYHLDYGPLARSARGSGWTRLVDAGQLRAWAAVAAGYESTAARPAPPAAALVPLLARAEATQAAATSGWQRWLERVEAFLRRQQHGAERSPWLKQLLDSLGAGLPSARRVEYIVNAGLLLLASALLVYWLHTGRIWQRLKMRTAALGGSTPRPTAATFDRLPDALAERVAARFAAAIERIDTDGLVPGARARTCRELAARLALEPGVAALAPLAPLVEQVSFAAMQPEADALVAADRALAEFEAGRP